MDYNYSLGLTYRKSDIDTVYRREFLQVFNMKEYDDDILAKKIDFLYENIKDDIKECIVFIKTHNQFPFELSDVICFQMLFTWENFFETHQYIRELLDNKINNKQMLLEHLEKIKNKE
jgi:hypothetical protein